MSDQIMNQPHRRIAASPHRRIAASPHRRIAASPHRRNQASCQLVHLTYSIICVFDFYLYSLIHKDVKA
jgi:hypothetical protein